MNTSAMPPRPMRCWISYRSLRTGRSDESRGRIEKYDANSRNGVFVNGIQVQSINHPDCTKRILTGTASELKRIVFARPPADD